MVERAPGRRPRRSTAVSQQLERMRRKKAELDAERRERDRQEEAAMRQLAQRAAIVERLSQKRDARIAVLEQKIGEFQRRIVAVREAAEEQVAAEDRRHVPALRALKRAGRSVEQIAALVDRNPRTVRSLLREEDGRRRSVAADGSPSTSEQGDAAS